MSDNVAKMSGVRALVVAFCLVCGCTSNRSVTVKTSVGVTIDPAPRELPFDPRAERLLSADHQLAQIAGHPIELALDAAISPEFRASFEEALIRAFESIAQDLDDLRKSDESAFHFAVQKLLRVEIRYDGTRRQDDVKFDEASGALVIRGPAIRTALVERGVIYYTILRAYDEDRTRAFAHLTPETVTPEQRYDYFRWLINDHLVRREAPAQSTKSEYAEAQRTLHVLRLAKLNQGKDARLAEKTTTWLISQGSYFRQQYVHKLKTVILLPAGAIFNQAASAWAKWVVSVYPTLDDETRVRLAKDLFVTSFQTDRAITHRAYPPCAWPGVDLFALGLSEVDRWRASGHPTQITKPRATSATDFFVCTRVFDPESRASIVPNCNQDWYRYALETQAGRKQLISAISSRNDPIFTEMVFRNIRSSTERSLDMLLVLLREVEKDSPNWTIGWRILADDYVNATFDIAVLEETRRLWVTHPERRGILLSGLVHMDRGARGNVDWKGFATAFGNPISPEELRDYLAVDPPAMFDVFLVWPALGRGWSRAAIIVPSLDAWLAAPEIKRAFLYPNVYQSLQRIIGEMCGDRDTKGLALMRGYLENRRLTHPGNSYAELIGATREKECEPPPPPPPPRNEVKLSPLKFGLPPLRIIQAGAE